MTGRRVAAAPTRRWRSRPPPPSPPFGRCELRQRWRWARAGSSQPHSWLPLRPPPPPPPPPHRRRCAPPLPLARLSRPGGGVSRTGRTLGAPLCPAPPLTPRACVTAIPPLILAHEPPASPAPSPPSRPGRYPSPLLAPRGHCRYPPSVGGSAWSSLSSRFLGSGPASRCARLRRYDASPSPPSPSAPIRRLSGGQPILPPRAWPPSDCGGGGDFPRPSPFHRWWCWVGDPRCHPHGCWRTDGGHRPWGVPDGSPARRRGVCGAPRACRDAIADGVFQGCGASPTAADMERGGDGGGGRAAEEYCSGRRGGRDGWCRRSPHR